MISLPESCELAVRRGEENTYLFVLNYLARPAKLVLNGKLRNLWTGGDELGEVELEGDGSGKINTFIF